MTFYCENLIVQGTITSLQEATPLYKKIINDT